MDVSRPTHGGRAFLQGLTSLAGAAGGAGTVAILLVGLPVVLAVRGILEAVTWVAFIVK